MRLGIGRDRDESREAFCPPMRRRQLHRAIDSSLGPVRRNPRAGVTEGGAKRQISPKCTAQTTFAIPISPSSKAFQGDCRSGEAGVGMTRLDGGAIPAELHRIAVSDKLPLTESALGSCWCADFSDRELYRLPFSFPLAPPCQSMQLFVDLATRHEISITPADDSGSARALTLVYPKWIPGNHRPRTVANVTGLRWKLVARLYPGSATR